MTKELMFWSLDIGFWDLFVICDLTSLVLGICDFRHKTPRQSHLSLTWPSFQPRFQPVGLTGRRVGLTGRRVGLTGRRVGPTARGLFSGNTAANGSGNIFTDKHNTKYNDESYGDFLP